MRGSRATGTAVCVLALLVQVHAADAASCESLKTVALAGATITVAEIVAPGAYQPPPPPPPPPGFPPAAANAPSPYATLPAFCRVAATLKPTSDSDIKMELWLPSPETWNGKFRGTGKGGLAGGLTPAAIGAGLRQGYATAGNNTGHEGDSRYVLDHPEQIKDFGWRAAHEMAVASKALIKAYYGKPPALSIISEGGGGNVAALSSAQRFPEDYDLVGVLGMSGYWTRLPFGQMSYFQATHKDAASFIPPAKYPVIHQGALEACDSLDGLKDGIIGDVEHCKFDPMAIQCKNGDGPDCLTPAQVEATRKIYRGAINSKGEQLYGPMYPGSELGWGRLAGERLWFITDEFFKYYVFKDPNWDYKARPVDFDKDTALADRPEIQHVNAINPDLKKFFARGGKLLMVDGWGDFDVPPKVAIDYYKNVVAKTGAAATKESMRFFMVPGMAHTPGTAGAENFNFDAVSILEEWKKTGKAPETLIVSHFKNGMEVGKRLVCQYPQVAMYNGSGNTEDPASYTCK
jgi:feruloyl esterase